MLVVVALTEVGSEEPMSSWTQHTRRIVSRAPRAQPILQKTVVTGHELEYEQVS